MPTVAQKQPYHEYPPKIRKKALGFVFDSVKFEDVDFGRIVRDSYFINLWPMLQYAHKNRIDELEYILDIRDKLLAMPGVHERER
ncbi:MAG: hypothetical protein J6S80_03155 [Alphaproteobacteria bacterium]|nr:hypothetical protein [Alphaproteobacteria bacterium]